MAKNGGFQMAIDIPYIFFAYLVLLANAIYGYTGVSIAKLDMEKQ